MRKLVLFLVILNIFLISSTHSKILNAGNTIERDSFYVRVNIIPDVDRLRVNIDSAYKIFNRRNKVIFESDEPNTLFFEKIKGEPAKAVYKPVIREYSFNRDEKAKEQLKLIKDKYKIDADLITYGKRLIVGGEEIVDNRQCIITAGTFKNIIDARSVRNALPERLSSRIITEIISEPKGTFKITDKNDTILKEVKDVIRVVPGTDDVITKVGVAGINRNWMIGSEKDIGYYGTIEIRISENGNLCAINELPIDQYLLGVVPSEIGADAPIEALKAQTVCARANAIRNMAGAKHIGASYDLCASVHCQFYAGTKFESENVKKAIAETKGEIPVYNGEIIDAVYHSNCGGHTENNENVWSGPPIPYLRGVYDNQNSEEWQFPLDEDGIERWIENPPKELFCHSGNPSVPNWAKKRFRWERKIKGQDLMFMVNRRYNIGRIKNLRVLERGISGRIVELEITGEGGTVIVEKELSIRRLLGDLYSAAFIMEKDMNGGFIETLTIKGAGSGHGVGMCQIGARTMAEKGYNYQEILKHYYSGIDIDKLY